MCVVLLLLQNVALVISFADLYFCLDAICNLLERETQITGRFFTCNCNCFFNPFVGKCVLLLGAGW